MSRYLTILLVLLIAGCVQPGPHKQSVSAKVATSVFDGAGYPVEACNSEYVGKNASCTLFGSASSILVRGNIISDGRLYVGGELLVGSDGRIKAVGCHTPRQEAVTLDCPGALISAGFINLHEHIDYSYQQPGQPPTLKWKHRYEWQKLTPEQRGFDYSSPKEPIRTEVSERAMLRHALSGTTAISGAKDYRAFLRNVKLANGPLGSPSGITVIDSTFPIPSADKEWLTAPCTPEQVRAIKYDKDNAYVPHVGEGTNEGARFEVDCVLDAIRIKTTPSAFIHAVAVDDAQTTRLKQQQVSIVASPRSNLQLYGATAPLEKLRAAGVNLALGTDWSVSGSLTQLDEARCLSRYNRDRMNGLLSWSDIHRMMTENGATAAGLQNDIGKLAAGEFADFVILDTSGRRSLGEVFENSALKETIAVFIAGRAASFPRAWTGMVPALDNCAPDPRNLCGQERTVCGADPQYSLDRLLRQNTYSIDDRRTCTPQPTDDCVVTPATALQ